MPTVTESDLKELKDLIIDLKVNQAHISGQIIALDEKLTGKMNALDEKLSGQITALDGRLSGQISVVDEKALD